MITSGTFLHADPLTYEQSQDHGAIKLVSGTEKRAEPHVSGVSTTRGRVEIWGEHLPQKMRHLPVRIAQLADSTSSRLSPCQSELTRVAVCLGSNRIHFELSATTARLQL
jgi:hypothetical protein